MANENAGATAQQEDVEVDIKQAERESSGEAWRFVLGCWLIECLLWGFPLSFGVFQAYYANNPLFSASRSIPTIGDLQTGFSNFGFPFISPICLRFPQYQRHILVLGWSTCVLSLVLASFAEHVWQLLLFQGVMYGVAWPLCYTPFLIMCNEWFVKKRGSVYGIIYGASGLGGIVLPYLLEQGLQSYGFRVTLRATAVAMCVLSGPGLLFIKPPPRHQGVSTGGRSLPGLAFLKDKTFLLFAAAAFVQGLSFYLPRFYLPSYAHALGLSHADGATLLAAYNLAQLTGQMGLGYLSDKVNIFIPVTLSTAVPALSTFFLWGTAKSFSPLLVFSLLCGSFGAAFSVLWTRMATYITTDVTTSTAIFGIFICERGVANMLAGPISQILTTDDIDVKAYGLSKYFGVVIFVGITSLVAASSGCGYLIQKKEESENSDDRGAFEPLHELESIHSLLSDEADSEEGKVV